jgi:alpha-soluble NSF attachment protein
MADLTTDKKANELLLKGNKILNSKLSYLFESQHKYEDAGETFEQAGNLFKLNKHWNEAAHAYNLSAQSFFKSDDKYRAADQFRNAANCGKKVSQADFVTYAQQSVDLFSELGKFSEAARVQQEIAETYDDSEDCELTLQVYQKAADLFNAANYSGKENDCLIKMTYLYIRLENYDRAIELLDSIATRKLECNLLKWSVYEQYVLGVLCQCAKKDLVAARRSLDMYTEQCVGFASQQEHIFLSKLLDALENYNVEDFTNAVVDFDNGKKLSPLLTTLLLKIKNSITTESENKETDVT